MDDVTHILKQKRIDGNDEQNKLASAYKAFSVFWSWANRRESKPGVLPDRQYLPTNLSSLKNLFAQGRVPDWCGVVMLIDKCTKYSLERFLD